VSDAKEAPVGDAAIVIIGPMLADLQRLAAQSGFDSINPLVRQVLWRYLYGHCAGMRDDSAPADFAEEIARPLRKSPSSSLRLAVLQRDGHRCVSCGAPAAQAALHMDHRLPVSKGGETTLENLQTLCQDCNRAKAANIIEFPRGVGQTDGEKKQSE
jgi:hypothetical protein